MTSPDTKPTVFIWFRNDLRVTDNQALSAACEHAKTVNANIQAVYIVTPAQWQAHDVGSRQLDFIRRHLQLVARALASLGIELTVWQCQHFADIPALWQRQLSSRNIVAIYAGREPELNEIRRDQAMLNHGLPLQLTNEHCLLAPGSVLTKSGEMYRVFTPFFRRWREIAQQYPVVPLGPPAPVGPAIADVNIESLLDTINRYFLPLIKSDNHYQWPAGEGEAQRRLQHFVFTAVSDYQQQRDFPALDGTSSLSPYLTLGVLSPRQCFAALLARFPAALADDTSPGRCWLSELVWREFYRHLLVAFPVLSMGGNFNPLADGIVWRNHPQEFSAWCEGRTGYPIVDAAMRQLNNTGWMHNRLRMVVASFLSKHLLIDWRWGERYFRQQLLDGDLAANNGGWQWSAGTGCDAQPWFRIFNPISQSEKFDADGSFIRHWLPELRHWPLAQLHRPVPEKSLFTGDYPAPIVEHSSARQRALSALAILKKA
ncbi:deoxyribodipyrimidine photo-lyase [Shewanella sp. A32]|uniref:deoxyribodipyrimidine photo-lyase n=1 Tax=Shewanella sp. A32 TaxID=3031327 RepID=UPI0023B97C29|nr:deoxyribodipyrimidine photo-lyase [Shewanella sp. A32]MDF0533896.1 deoxyribodipyrimidine photo-lyase [Shewanella sp. A32]